MSRLGFFTMGLFSVKIRAYCCGLIDDYALDLDVASFYAFCLTKFSQLFHLHWWVDLNVFHVFGKIQMNFSFHLYSSFSVYGSCILSLWAWTRKPNPCGWVQSIRPKDVFGWSGFFKGKKLFFYL